MRENRLLERISAWEQGAPHSTQTRTEVLLRSIMDHLTRILNTRQGSVQLDPLFGVPDFTNLAGGLSGGSLHAMEEEIERMVRQYEPRIKSPRIQLQTEHSDVLALRFTLEGMIDIDDREIPLRLATTVSSSGRISLV